MLIITTFSNTNVNCGKFKFTSAFISVKVGVTFLFFHSMSFSENFAVVYRCLSKNST